MDKELQQATQFQNFIESLFDSFLNTFIEYLEYIPYQKIQIQHVLITVIIIVSSIISYRLGKKKETNNFLSEKFKKKLDDFEQDVQVVNRRIEKNEIFIDKIKYFQILCFVVLTSYLIYQGLIDYTETKMIIAGVAIIALELGAQIYKNHLHSQIKLLNFKAQEDKNQQYVIMQKLLGEMSDKMKKILSDLVSQQIVKESELEKENIKKHYEQRIKTQQAENESEKEQTKRKYESKINSLTLQNTNERTLCKSNICKKKRKLVKEKLKRSDWFIRNVSEFAWCEICASNMFEDPSQSFIVDQNVSEQSINLDDSIMLNSTVADESLNDDDEKVALFNRLCGSKGEVIRKECESSCLSKYFFLCKKVGEKYNQWTDLIDKFESKYKAEKQKIKQINGIN